MNTEGMHLQSFPVSENRNYTANRKYISIRNRGKNPESRQSAFHIAQKLFHFNTDKF